MWCGAGRYSQCGVVLADIISDVVLVDIVSMVWSWQV